MFEQDELNLLPCEHPLLRQKAMPFPIERLSDPSVQAFLDAVIEKGEFHEGVGIAAPQLGQSLRAFILAPKPGPRYPHSPLLPPRVILNPRILEASDEKEVDWEGCLSVPGFKGLVARHSWIVAEFTERNGEMRQERFEGFVARIFQHELDHLDGILYIDRVEKNTELEPTPVIRKL